MQDPWHWNVTFSVKPRGMSRLRKPARGEGACSCGDRRSSRGGAEQEGCCAWGWGRGVGTFCWSERCTYKGTAFINFLTSHFMSRPPIFIPIAGGSKISSTLPRSPAGTDIIQINRKKSIHVLFICKWEPSQEKWRPREVTRPKHLCTWLNKACKCDRGKVTITGRLREGELS